MHASKEQYISVNFKIENVPLIKQDKSMSCWYASAQMLIAWKRRIYWTNGTVKDPSEDPIFKGVYDKNSGLMAKDFGLFSRRLGLFEFPPMTPNPGYIASTLKKHGPIWFAGYHQVPFSAPPLPHVVVITGITDSRILINDPAIGKRDISFNRFIQILQPITGADNKYKLSANFMYLP